MKIAIAMLSIALLSSCSSKTTSDVKNFSSEAVKYTDTAISLIDTTNEKVNSYSSDQLIMIRSGIHSTSSKELGDAYSRINKSIAPVKSELLVFLEQTLLLNKYFKNLEEISSYKAGEETSNQVDSLAKNINGLSTSIGRKVPLDSNQLDKLKDLSAFVADNYQSSLIRQHINKNAIYIATALAYQVKQMENISGILHGIKESENNKFEADYIIQPYKTERVFNIDKWKSDRIKLLKSRDGELDIDATVTAAKKLFKNWIALVKSDNTPSESIVTEMRRMQDLVSTINIINDTDQREKQEAP